MTDTPPDRPPLLDIDWLKTLAGALAAVTTAVLLSTLGAAGTLIGAALGSVAATVGTAVYTRGLATSREKVAKVAKVDALQKVGIAQAEVRRAARQQGDDPAVEAHLDHADERLSAAREDLAADQEPPVAAGSFWAGLPWKRIGLVAAGTFAVAVLALSAFELLGGKPLSSYTGGTDGGGTSISRLTGSGGQLRDDDRKDRDREDRGDPDDAGSGGSDQQDEPGGSGGTGGSEQDQQDDPSQSPSPSDDPTDDDPAEEPGGTPDDNPAPTPSETPGPTGGSTPSAPAPSPTG